MPRKRRSKQKIEAEMTLNDFFTANGLKAKIGIVKKSKSEKKTLDYLCLDDGHFTTFGKSTTFTGDAQIGFEAGVSFTDVCYIQQDLSKYLDVKIELFNPKNGNSILLRSSDMALDEPIDAKKNAKVVKDCLLLIGDVEVPDAYKSIT